MFRITLFLPVLLLTVTFTKSEDECNLSQELIDEIRSYQTVVDKIIDATTNGQFKGATFKELATFVDKFGARLSGTRSLEDSIDYLLDLMKSYGVQNVHGEDVQVPLWVRGNESAKMLLPRETNLAVLALGGSVGTPDEGIEADVVVVRSLEDLHQNYSNAVAGKIVVFNYEYIRYGVSVSYRRQGPIEAAKHGAVAALIRSVTDFSMNLVHTGQTSYEEGVTKIPAVAITVEDANMFQRYQERGQTVRVKLNIQTESFPEVKSRNTVGEVVGSENPEKVVLVSGHLDSWDVGVGAMDDGGGAFISWYSLVVLKSLGIVPKRTVRAVLWTAEENGMAGVIGYDAAHKDELKDFIFVMESDEGTFTPLGLEFIAGKKRDLHSHRDIEDDDSISNWLLAPINATQAVRSSGGVGSDITIWKDVIPTGSLLNDNGKYFWYHHTKADTMDVLDPDTLDKATALWASVAYVVADLKDDFPRDFSDKGFYTIPNVFYVVLLSLVGLLLH
ncbi:hypothetical protein NQ314_014305 [Rhamnusium bicolor]|uniref:Carboxypeptidase Q n=1 Tax=Rhamnusium bicolor TaxID=1586634 RepID=A0AAV8X2C1_9CUCU|nr:hypothetical protein NQ314_014305 [Rhamnusium bicolor]